MASRPTDRAAGIFWVKQADWARYVTLCIDRSNLPASYEKWLYSANKAAQTFARHGWEIVKVEVDLDAFLVWCKRRGLDVDGKARTEYANEVAAAQVRARDHTKH